MILVPSRNHLHQGVSLGQVSLQGAPLVPGAYHGHTSACRPQSPVFSERREVRCLSLPLLRAQNERAKLTSQESLLRSPC